MRTTDRLKAAPALPAWPQCRLSGVSRCKTDRAEPAPEVNEAITREPEIVTRGVAL